MTDNEIALLGRIIALEKVLTALLVANAVTNNVVDPRGYLARALEDMKATAQNEQWVGVTDLATADRVMAACWASLDLLFRNASERSPPTPPGWGLQGEGK